MGAVIPARLVARHEQCACVDASKLKQGAFERRLAVYISHVACGVRVFRRQFNMPSVTQRSTVFRRHTPCWK